MKGRKARIKCVSMKMLKELVGRSLALPGVGYVSASLMFSRRDYDFIQRKGVFLKDFRNFSQYFSL